MNIDSERAANARLTGEILLLEADVARLRALLSYVLAHARPCDIHEISETIQWELSEAAAVTSVGLPWWAHQDGCTCWDPECQIHGKE